MRHFIQPVATKLGIGNISWHTFRHTYSSLLRDNGEDPKVVQELLRHSSIKVTMDLHAGCDFYQAQGAVEGSGDDCSQEEGGTGVGGSHLRVSALTLHTVT